jgi:hypothetical protein
MLKKDNASPSQDQRKSGRGEGFSVFFKTATGPEGHPKKTIDPVSHGGAELTEK